MAEKEENNKTPLITFAKLNKYFLIPFIAPIFCMLTNYCLALLIATNTVKRLAFIGTIYMGIMYTLTGLLHFFPYFRKNIGKGNGSKKPNLAIKYFHKKERKDKKYYNFFTLTALIILLGLLLATFELLMTITLDKTKFEFRLYLLFFVPIFSKFILKENFYKHHYLSLIIALIGVILLLIPICLVMTKEDIITNILIFILGTSNALFMVLIKYLIQKYYYSPIYLSFLFGISSIIITCIAFSIYSLIKYHDFNYFNESFDFSQKENNLYFTLYIFLSSIFGIIYNILYLLALYYFSPILILVSDMISPFLMWIALTIFDGGKMPDVIINPIGYLIVLLASLVYNEIIIFNFWGLSKNTKKFVEKRVTQESIQIQMTEIVHSDSFNCGDEEENFT